MCTDRLDPPDDLVARHARKDDAGKLALDRERIAVADTAGMDADQQFLRARRRHVSLDAPQLRSALRRDHRNHLRHGIAPRWYFEDPVAIRGSNRGPITFARLEMTLSCRPFSRYIRFDMAVLTNRMPLSERHRKSHGQA